MTVERGDSSTPFTWADLRPWYEHAISTGCFRFFETRRDATGRGGPGYNYAPPFGWNRGNDRDDLDLKGIKRVLRDGGNVICAAGEGGLIVDADSAQAVAAVEARLLDGAKTLSLDSPRGRQWLLVDDCAGLRSGGIELAPDIEVRTANDAYGMAPGSRRSSESYKADKANRPTEYPAWYLPRDIVPVISTPKGTRHLLFPPKKARRRSGGGSGGGGNGGSLVGCVRTFTGLDLDTVMGFFEGEFEEREQDGARQFNGPCPRTGEGSLRFMVKEYQPRDGADPVPDMYRFACRACCSDEREVGAAVDDVVMGAIRDAIGDDTPPPKTSAVVEGWAEHLARTRLDEDQLLPALRRMVSSAKADSRFRGVEGHAEIEALDDRSLSHMVTEALTAMDDRGEHYRGSRLYEAAPTDDIRDLRNRLDAMGMGLVWNELAARTNIEDETGIHNDDSFIRRHTDIHNRLKSDCLAFPSVRFKADKRHNPPKVEMEPVWPEHKKPPIQETMDRADALAKRASYDPFREFLDGLPDWDGAPRLDTFLSRAFQVDGHGYGVMARFALRNTLIGAIKRTHEPGAKHDEVAVLIGEEGIGKSSLWRHLLPDKTMFSDGLDFADDKNRQVESTLGCVIVESPELAGRDRTDIRRIYAFLSRQEEQVRLAYGRGVLRYPRRAVIVGTVNEEDALPVLAGHKGRRFLPVMVERRFGTNEESVRHVMALAADERNQLWAEAVHAHRNGDLGFLPGEFEKMAAEIVRGHAMGDDGMDEAVNRFLQSRIPWEMDGFFQLRDFALAISQERHLKQTSGAIKAGLLRAGCKNNEQKWLPGRTAKLKGWRVPEGMECPPEYAPEPPPKKKKAKKKKKRPAGDAPERVSASSPASTPRKAEKRRQNAPEPPPFVSYRDWRDGLDLTPLIDWVKSVPEDGPEALLSEDGEASLRGKEEPWVESRGGWQVIRRSGSNRPFYLRGRGVTAQHYKSSRKVAEAIVQEALNREMVEDALAGLLRRSKTEG